MTINERVSPERLDTISAEYSRPNHTKNFSATDWEIAAMARELKELRNNNESLRGEVLIAHRTLMNQWAQLQQYRAAAEPVVYIGKQMLESLCDEGGRICGRVWRSNTDELSGESRIPLYAAPQVTSVPEELLSAMEDVLRISDRDHDAWNRAKYAIAAIRSAPVVQAEQEPVSQPYTLPEPITRNDADGWWMYKGRRVGGGCAEWYNRALDDCRAAIASGNSPAIPEGYALVPSKLTAENGAKGALSGEFSETKFISCPECFGDDECETCDGSGRIEITVPVSWTSIKEIWAKGVEHFAAAPKQEAE